MTVRDLIAACRALGVNLTPEPPAGLYVRAPRRPPDDLLELLLVHKVEIVEFLEAEAVASGGQEPALPDSVAPAPSGSLSSPLLPVSESSTEPDVVDHDRVNGTMPVMPDRFNTQLAVPLDASEFESQPLDVPGMQDAKWLYLTEGIPAAYRRWTTFELVGLLEADPPLTPETLRLLMVACREFDGEIWEVRPRREPAADRLDAQLPRRSTYAHPWPDALPDLGIRRPGPFAPCSTCGTGTFATFGDTALCGDCARAREGEMTRPACP
jgi:hypothetical protein